MKMSLFKADKIARLFIDVMMSYRAQKISLQLC